MYSVFCVWVNVCVCVWVWVCVCVWRVCGRGRGVIIHRMHTAATTIVHAYTTCRCAQLMHTTVSGPQHVHTVYIDVDLNSARVLQSHQCPSISFMSTCCTCPQTYSDYGLHTSHVKLVKVVPPEPNRPRTLGRSGLRVD